MTIEKIEIDPAAATLTLHFEEHCRSYPLADLQDWLTFHREQRDLFPKYRARHEEIITALETVLAEHTANLLGLGGPETCADPSRKPDAG